MTRLSSAASPWGARSSCHPAVGWQSGDSRQEPPLGVKGQLLGCLLHGEYVSAILGTSGGQMKLE